MLTLPVPIPDDKRTLNLFFYFHLFVVPEVLRRPLNSFKHHKEVLNQKINLFLFQQNVLKCSQGKGFKFSIIG